MRFKLPNIWLAGALLIALLNTCLSIPHTSRIEFNSVETFTDYSDKKNSRLCLAINQNIEKNDISIDDSIAE